MQSDNIDPKQKLLLEYLIANRQSLVRCISITKKDYFEPPLDRAVEFIVSYFEKHHGCPSIDQIFAESGVSLEKRELEDHEQSYFLEEFESFCRQEAMTKAILDSVDLIQSGKESAVQDLVREALLVKIDNTLGSSLFDNPLARINHMQDVVDQRKLGIDAIDDLIGGIRRGELGLFYAVSSGGKSLMLANVAYLLAKQELDVVVISLELNEELYNKRLDCIVTDHTIAKHHDDAEEISDCLDRMKSTMGDITTKKMRAKSSPSDIRSYLTEYHLMRGKYPDVLVVDYLALMGTSSNYTNKFDEHEEITVGVRDLADEFQMYAFGAGQVGRTGQDLIKIGPEHVSGGISTIMSCDWAIALTASEEDIENNQMVAAQLKIRNAAKTPKPKVIYRDPETLRITSTPLTGKKLSSPVVKESKAESVSSAKGKDKLKKALKLG